MSTEEPQEEDEDLRYFVRIGQTDLDGTKSVERSLTDMNGIGHRAARIIEEMERQGVVSKASPTGKREVLVGDHGEG